MYITLVVHRLVVSLYARRLSAPNPGVANQPKNEQNYFEELVWAGQRKQMYQAKRFYNTEYMDGQGKNKVGVGHV